jgi:hypothetical protein
VYKTLKAPLWVVVYCLFFAFVFALPRNVFANLVTDGDFTSVTYSGTTGGLTTLYGQFGTGTGSTLAVAGWSTTGYNFVYAPGTADVGTHGAGTNAGSPKEAPGQFNFGGYGNTYMWGPNNGSANGLPANSPAGGNFVAMDGAFQVGAITQTITGLTVGQIYVLKFYWAGAQEDSFHGITTDNMTVTLGSQVATTPTVTVPDEGFSGWSQVTFYYTATSATETLSFLANGTPTGEPPFALLAGVDLEVVPDFSNWLVFIGFGTACIALEMMRRRRRRMREAGSEAAPLFGDAAELPVSE